MSAGANSVPRPSSENIALSTEGSTRLGTVEFEDDALVVYDPNTSAVLQIFDLRDEFGTSRERPNGDLTLMLLGLGAARPGTV